MVNETFTRQELYDIIQDCQQNFYSKPMSEAQDSITGLLMMKIGVVKNSEDWDGFEESK